MWLSYLFIKMHVSDKMFLELNYLQTMIVYNICNVYVIIICNSCINVASKKSCGFCSRISIADTICDWILENQPNCHARQAFSNSLAQLIATLIQYPFTVALPGLTDWSVFLERVFPTTQIHNWDNRTHGGHYMEGMSLKLTPVVVRCLLGPLRVFGTMSGTVWTHS